MENKRGTGSGSDRVRSFSLKPGGRFNLRSRFPLRKTRSLPRVCESEASGFQPEGQADSSRWSQRSADHRKEAPTWFAPRRGATVFSDTRSGCELFFRCSPVVCAPLRPLATICQPFRLRSSARERRALNTAAGATRFWFCIHRRTINRDRVSPS